MCHPFSFHMQDNFNPAPQLASGLAASSSFYPAIAWDSAALRPPYYSLEPGKVRAVISSWNWHQSFLFLAWLSSSHSAWLS